MKKKIIILGICLVLAAGTVAAVASGAYNNQKLTAIMHIFLMWTQAKIFLWQERFCLTKQTREQCFTGKISFIR